jgi:hypothetical protein
MPPTADFHRLSRIRIIACFVLPITAAWGALALAGSLPTGTLQFHVAPTGNDANPGTAARPFATLERARDAAAERYPELRRFWDEPRQFPHTNTFQRNVIWNPSRKPAAWRRGGRTIEPVDGVVMEYPGLQCQNNWTARSNPGFTDPAEDDFTLRADAEALRRLPGMQPIDFRAVGPRADLP